MKIKNYEKKTIVTRALCDCGGSFEYETGSLFTDLLTNKDEFEHTCNKCGKKELFNRRYPDINTIEVEVGL